ncbi:MAG: hypothetical protein COA78_36165 [Blastopirellula sp.]|nr:MAG: hypothetical protein COA78_36165 [Blastopirellula sp.]
MAGSICFTFSYVDPNDPNLPSRIIEGLRNAPQHHSFLADQDPQSEGEQYTFDPIHRHARWVANNEEVLDILARGRLNKLGAYSTSHQEPSRQEKDRIDALLSAKGPYKSYSLWQGDDPTCAVCSQYNNHLFSNFFYEVAWDWCIQIVWADVQECCIIFLTDTD